MQTPFFSKASPKKDMCFDQLNGTCFEKPNWKLIFRFIITIRQYFVARLPWPVSSPIAKQTCAMQFEFCAYCRRSWRKLLTHTCTSPWCPYMEFGWHRFFLFFFFCSLTALPRPNGAHESRPAITGDQTHCQQCPSETPHLSLKTHFYPSKLTTHG